MNLLYIKKTSLRTNILILFLPNMKILNIKKTPAVANFKFSHLVIFLYIKFYEFSDNLRTYSALSQQKQLQNCNKVHIFNFNLHMNDDM